MHSEVLTILHLTVRHLNSMQLVGKVCEHNKLCDIQMLWVSFLSENFPLMISKPDCKRHFSNIDFRNKIAEIGPRLDYFLIGHFLKIRYLGIELKH